MTFTPYPTLTPSITPFGGEQTRTPSAGGCLVPPGWITYTVQPGDNLFRLSQRFNLSLDDLVEANCIEDRNTITAGQLLYVPPGSAVTPVPSTAVFAQITPAVGTASFNCGNPAATITDPRPDTVLRGTVGLYGSATHPDFQFYRVQIAGGSSEDSSFITIGERRFTPVIGGQLDTLNTNGFAPGYYWLRLTVVDNTGNFLPQCTVRVRIER